MAFNFGKYITLYLMFASCFRTPFFLLFLILFESISNKLVLCSMPCLNFIRSMCYRVYSKCFSACVALVVIHHLLQTKQSFSGSQLCILQVFGSAGVIGNPMGFARSLGVGIRDFLSVPAKSILKVMKFFINCSSALLLDD